MRFFVTTAVSTAVIGLAVLLSPAAALACTPTSHCYGIAQWDVEGKSGSGFKGLDAILGVNSEALYAWTQEGYYNHIQDEAWLEFDAGHYWNESGEILGCATLLPCTPEHESRWFWYAETEKYGNTGGESSEGNKGPGEWEVTDEYEPSIGGWYVKSANWTTDIYGQPPEATSITTGVETTTNSALNSAGAQNLDWEDLQGKWHYSDWASGSSHAKARCNSPAKASWITKYTTFGYGVNIEFPCTTESDALMGEPSTGESEPSTHTPPALGSPTVSSAIVAMSPNLNATSPMSMSELKTRVTALAATVGEPDPSSIEVAKAPRAQAIAAVTPAISFGETGEQKEWLSEPTYAVVLHGHFESTAALGGAQPEGEPTKPYTTLSLVLDAKTGAVSTFDLTKASQRQPAIAELGAVSAL
jgi:hypothetical protein